VESAIVREGAVAHEKVTVGMPLDQVPARRDGDDDAGPGFCAALREIPQQLSSPAEDAAQEPGHGASPLALARMLTETPLRMPARATVPGAEARGSKKLVSKKFLDVQKAVP
jgi:hypothetical protein